jgi:hypothetical protein
MASPDTAENEDLAERDDPARHRFKRHDDATVAVLRFG